MTALCVVSRVTGGAESRVGGRDRIHGDRHGSKAPSQCDRSRLLDDFPGRSMHTAVEQGRASVGNPDALLFLVDAPGTDAGAPHYRAGHGALNRSVWPLGAARRIAPAQHSHSRNRRYRGRSDDR